MSGVRPSIVVLSTLFPHSGQPGAGLFIKERMFRVARLARLCFVVPVPWFPFQGLIRRWKPGFRPVAPRYEVRNGIKVHYPRFLSVPGAFKWLDGFFMALGCLPTLLRLRRSFDFNLIDAHFAYPEGYAATLLGRWLRVPVTITMRGTEVPIARDPRRRRRMLRALSAAARVFAVSDSLKRHAASLGVSDAKMLVVGNGVDTEKFHRISQSNARQALHIPQGAPVMVSVGALVERKGFHRVMDCVPELRQRFPGLRYLIVGGASPEGDWSRELRTRAKELAIDDCVHFLGTLAPEALKQPLSAADVFVLATRNEGWANVFLEAMACGLPVVTTDVGGNAEVVANANLGIVVPFGHRQALAGAIAEALRREWNREGIASHAASHSWDHRVEVIVREMEAIVAERAGRAAQAGALRSA